MFVCTTVVFVCVCGVCVRLRAPHQVIGDRPKQVFVLSGELEPTEEEL